MKEAFDSSVGCCSVSTQRWGSPNFAFSVCFFARKNAIDLSPSIPVVSFSSFGGNYKRQMDEISKCKNLKRQKVDYIWSFSQRSKSWQNFQLYRNDQLRLTPFQTKSILETISSIIAHPTLRSLHTVSFQGVILDNGFHRRSGRSSYRNRQLSP